MSRLRITILGSGSSGGVPRVGGPDGHGDWGACDPGEPKNRRTRCGVLVERAHSVHKWDPDHVTSVLIDTSPDLREQLVRAGVKHAEAVLYTHDHADQTHGLDDLRVFAFIGRRRMPVYMDEATAKTITQRFSYAFVQPEGSLYPPILEQRPMPPLGEAFGIDGPAGPIMFTALLQNHGRVDSLGFRMGSMAYSNDVVDMPEETFEALEGLDLWVVDALQYKPHKTHAHLEKTLQWIERLKPKRAVLTNLHTTMDYQTLLDELPDGVAPAYDGMRLEV
ncbi:MAG: MBL fold metallo-hydrolase [Pseudomonadota bacterium]